MAKKYTFELSASKNPGMVQFVSFLALYAVNALVIMGAFQFFPQQVVLGTSTIPYFWAVAHSMGVLALIGIFAMPFVHEIENWRGRMFTPQEWTLSYFVVNFVALWGITRFAEQFGLGMSAWYVVALVALVMDLVQGGVMMQLGKIIKK